MMDQLYKATPDGYCGDEDNGQTSAWYIFSAMGFYPVCPATRQYVIGTPLFRKTTLRFDNGKTFVITAEGNSDRNVYIQSAKLNDTSHNLNWIDHDVVQRGGALQLVMSSNPNIKRGTEASAYPYSLSLHEKK